MDWCRLSAGYYRDPALVRAGEAAEVLFLRMISYCAETETGGRVPVAYLPNLTPKGTAARRDALLREGLIVRDGDDVVLRSWERIQSAHDAGVDRKRRDRERKAAARAAERAGTVPGTSADVSTDSPRTVRPESARKEVEVEEERTKTPSSPAGDDLPVGFADFWRTYPNSAGKQAAIKAYRRALRTVDAAELVAAACRYRDDPNRDDSFTAHAASWLNAGRWEDPPLPSRIGRAVGHVEHSPTRGDGGTPDWAPGELLR